MPYDIQLVTPDKSEAKAILGNWEKEDRYRAGILNSFASELNTKARGYPYLESSETRVASTVVKTDVPIEGPVTIVYIDGRSDSGLPHTRGKSGIALPVFLLWNPSDKTVQHELVHISQKHFPQRWWAVYSKLWNIRVATESEFMSIPEKLRLKRRINPDTLGTPYTVWQGRYMPMSVFVTTTPDLKNCKRGFWDLTMSQWTWESPPGWESTIGVGFNDEHPNEIAAHWIDGSAGEEKQRYFSLNPI